MAGQSQEPDFGSKSDFYTFAPESLADVLPAFEIVREVGKGSMGIVYEARVRHDRDRVAIKVLPPSLTLTERALARFIREGEIMSKITHPGIVEVYDHGQRDRLHYFVMEFIDGVNLEDRLAVGPLPARQAAQIGEQVARALQYAHDHGVVHRDIKPSNLILKPDGSVVITDFGLARETGTGSMTESGAIVGTPMYMAPEQITGDRGDTTTRVDVYGLGASLYTLVTGRPPFEGPTAQTVLRQVIDEDPARPSKLRHDLPTDLEAVILMALEKDPTRRYGSAEELGDDLARFLAGDKVRAKVPGPLARFGRTVRKHPAVSGLVLLVVVLTISAILLQMSSRRGAIETELAHAAGLVAKAVSAHDEQLRPLDSAQREMLLRSAIAAASGVIEQEPSTARAWFVRAQAHHHLGEFRFARRDLDRAEDLLGEPTPEILHYRIDALRGLYDTESRRQLHDDLRVLLEIDPSPYNRTIVAFHLLDLARTIPVDTRDELLDRTEAIIEPVPEPDASVAVIRARILELRGDHELALSSMRGTTEKFHGNPLVHGEAAAMLLRFGRDIEGAEQAELARILDPRRAETEEPDMGVVDRDEIERFLRELQRVERR